MLGWALQSDILKSVIPGAVTMKPNAALGLFLCGLSLWLVGRPDLAARQAGRVLASLALLLGAAICFEYATSIDLGVDQMLFQEEFVTEGTAAPGRTAPTTALSLVFFGGAVFLCRIRRLQHMAGVLCVVTAYCALVSLTSYLYQTEGSEGLQPDTQMAFHGALIVLVLAGGMLALLFGLRPSLGSGVATAYLPRLLAGVILVPLVLGWLRIQGERAGYYNAGFGVVLMVAATISLLCVLVWWNTRSVARLDSKRSAAEEALRTNEKRTRQIIESGYDAFIAMDVEGRVTDWNPRAEAMFGFTRAQVIGGMLSELIIPHRYRERHRAGLKRFLATGEGTVLGRPIEISALHADGREFPVELSISPMAWGNTWVFNAFIHDITERKEKDALAAASAAKDHFIAMLSHELRTPLTPVLATILDLEADPNLSPPVREAIEMIQRNVKLEARLIDDLLDVTRIARGKLKIERGVVDVNSILRNAIDVCRSELLKKKVRIDFDPQAPTPTVQGDAPRLLQVFWNLLQNAVKFSPRGGNIAIRTLAPAPGRLAVEIEDNGIGMSADVLSRIFTPFEQADASINRRFGGLGLGLALSKALIEAHGGRIEATSRGANQGTLMKVELQSTLATSVRPDPVPQTEAGKQIGLRILIIEDHPDTRRTLERLLTKWGHTVSLAEDLATARARVASEPFDLLLTDLGLPDGHGTELMCELRTRGSTLPGIALSGFGTESDSARSLEAGFIAHLTKPVGTHDLQAQIAQVVRDIPSVASAK